MTPDKIHVNLKERVKSYFENADILCLIQSRKRGKRVSIFPLHPIYHCGVGCNGNSCVAKNN